MKLGVRGLLAVAATLLCACSSTPGAKSPGIDKAVAAVSIGAEVVRRGCEAVLTIREWT